MSPSALLLTPRQAADLLTSRGLKTCAATVRRWTKLGRLRHSVTPSGRVFIDPKDLDAVAVPR